jgi:hypothetical protein
MSKTQNFNYKGMLKDLVTAGFGGVRTSSLKGRSIAEVANCDHICKSDCRRDGCDAHGCVCGGEWHNE